ncbi:PaaI family thioesterase [bacterium]|nr:PaaI family thioesterase [bacterium]
MIFEPKDSDFERKVKDSFFRQPHMSFIGAKLITVKPGYCEIHLPYRNELSQQHGFFHAGVIGTIADTAGGYAAFSLMGADSSVLSVEYKLNLMAPGDGELLMGRASVIKHGRTLSVCRSDVFVIKNGIEKLCATALMTTMTMVGMADEPPVL